MWSLMIMKPDIVAHPILLQTTLRELLDAGIVIGGVKRLRLTPEKAQELYKMHQGKFFFGRLVRHISSGPVVVMRVQGNVRALLGSSQLWPLSEETVSLRQRFALSDVRNVAHASDSETATNELQLFEPLPYTQSTLDAIFSKIA